MFNQYLEIEYRFRLDLHKLKLGISRLKRGLRWRSGQSARLSPLRLRVRSPVRTLLEPSASLTPKELVNTLPKVVALQFPPTRKLTGWFRINTDREVKSQLSHAKIASLG